MNSSLLTVVISLVLTVVNLSYLFFSPRSHLFAEVFSVVVQIPLSVEIVSVSLLFLVAGFFKVNSSVILNCPTT